MTLKAMIVDDEPLAVDRLAHLLAQVSDLDLIGTASDGAQALRLVGELQPDVLLLDIDMPELDGFGVVRALPDNAPPVVIFVTAYDSFAVKAFECAAVDYLVKPVELGRLQRAIDRARAVQDTLARRNGLAELQSAVAGIDGAGEAQPAYAEEFWIPLKSEMVRVRTADIDHIEAERDYMRLHVGDRSYLLHETISNLEQKLDPEAFVRVHRSAIVRRGCVVRLRRNSYGAWIAELRSGRAIKVGRKYVGSVHDLTGRGPQARG